MRILLLCCLAPLTACIGEPHECDIATGEVFAQSRDIAIPEYVDQFDFPFAELATAVGGTQRFDAQIHGCDNPMPLTNAFVRTETPQLGSVTSSSPFDFHAVAAGASDLLLMGDEGNGHVSLQATAIDHVALVGQELGEPGAFYVGTPYAMIQLLDSTGAALVDRNLSVVTGALPLGDKWNHLALAGAAAGSYSVAIQAGDRAWPLDVTIVDHISDVTPREPSVVAEKYYETYACFFAQLDGVDVAGVPWTYDFEPGHGTVRPSRPNCLVVTAGTGANEKLEQDVTAHALGFSATVHVRFTD